MSRRKKILVYSLLAGLVATVVVYFTINVVLDRVSRRALTGLVHLADQQGLEVVDPSFGSVWLSGLLAATWSDAQAEIRLAQDAQDEAAARGRRWALQGNRIRVEYDMSGRATLVVDQVVVTGAAPTDEEDAGDDRRRPADRRVEVVNIRCPFSLELFDPEQSLRELLPEFAQILSEGHTALPLEMTGKLAFSLKGEPAEVRLRVQRQHDVYKVVLPRADVMSLADRFDDKLTEAEADLIAAHPFRAARLLEIKNSAESSSERARERDDSVPQDAYRHVLWSFLLARAYGEAFAEQVGDAHETGDTGNTEAQREMDLHNNAIGRTYAADDELARKDVLRRLLADPEVRREP